MTVHDRLRRSYERLMWTYPRWYRRERGAEVVSSLLDDAAPGQTRPTVGEVVDLVRAGTRTRLRRPRGVGAWVVTWVLTAYAALAGAAVVAALVGYDRPPSVAESIAAASTAMAREPDDRAGPVIRCDIICPGWDGHDDVVAFTAPLLFDRTDRVVVWFDPPPDEVRQAATQAHDRLVAAGWHADPVWFQDSSIQQLSASRGGLRILLVTGASDVPPVSIVVSRGFTPAAVLAWLGGVVGGAIAGRLGAVWAVRRYRRHAPARRRWINYAAVPFLVLVAPTFAVGALMLVGDIGQNLSPKLMKAPLAALEGAWPVTTVAVLSALLAVGLIAPPGRRGDGAAAVTTLRNFPVTPA